MTTIEVTKQYLQELRDENTRLKERLEAEKASHEAWEQEHLKEAARYRAALEKIAEEGDPLLMRMIADVALGEE